MKGSKSMPPLGDVIAFVEHAIDRAQLYVQDTDYIPKEKDVEQIEDLARSLLLYGSIARTTAETMRRRLKGAAPFH